MATAFTVAAAAAHAMIVQVDDADLLDLLHLSINSTGIIIPWVVEHLLDAPPTSFQLPAAEALEVLHTAVERGSHR